MLFERKLAGGLGVSCEGGPLGSLMVPLTWTDRKAELLGQLLRRDRLHPVLFQLEETSGVDGQAAHRHLRDPGDLER